MKRKAVLAFALAVACAAALVPTASASSSAPPAVTPIPIAGNGPNASFNGTFTIQRFANRAGQLVAVGTLAGQLTNTTTEVTQAVTRTVALPVAITQSSCEILDLVLGPLDLNLLGLVVHLDTVHLNITAQQGPGNLLGNLLCAIAGLLDNTGSPTGGLAALLTRIFGILG